MCLMVDTEGPIKVASQRGEDKKVDQVVCELARYDVVVGALQETKWFGSEVYEINESIILTSGRSKPAEGEAIRRGEGVALVLRGLALVAWKCGGKQWKAWSSRAVSTSLQMDGSTKRIHMVPCYAPTRATSREDKDAFFEQLDIISSVPSGEIYVFLGDFSACVGSRDSVNDQWNSVRALMGLGQPTILA